jgi:hemolysin activation/secretion protein
MIALFAFLLIATSHHGTSSTGRTEFGVTARLSQPWSWFDQAKISVLTFVQHTDALSVCISEQEKLIRL